ncbi:hypothetical protein M0804_002542 [Polistes exclamans]|nr:hypothetical protein M0804_002542 [Polistes exclamans]
MVSSLTLMMIDDDGESLEEPAHVREMSKGNSRRNVNDPAATNDYVDTDLPIFEPTAPNVTAFVGQTVYLPCRVRKLADKVHLCIPKEGWLDGLWYANTKAHTNAHTNVNRTPSFLKFLICALCSNRLVSRWGCSGLICNVGNRDPITVEPGLASKVTTTIVIVVVVVVTIATAIATAPLKFGLRSIEIRTQQKMQGRRKEEEEEEVEEVEEVEEEEEEEEEEEKEKGGFGYRFV